MEGTVRAVLRGCPECQVAGKGEALQVPITPLKPVSKPFYRWGIDFIGRMPKSRSGNRWILLAIDHFTNWVVAESAHSADVKTVADFIYRKIALHFGKPVEIISDRGAQFRADLVREYCRRNNIQQCFTSAYHPRSNGKTDRTNGVIGKALTKYAFKHKHRWDEYLDTTVWATRVRQHSVTKHSVTT